MSITPVVIYTLADFTSKVEEVLEFSISESPVFTESLDFESHLTNSSFFDEEYRNKLANNNKSNSPKPWVRISWNRQLLQPDEEGLPEIPVVLKDTEEGATTVSGKFVTLPISLAFFTNDMRELDKIEEHFSQVRKFTGSSISPPDNLTDEQLEEFNNLCLNIRDYQIASRDFDNLEQFGSISKLEIELNMEFLLLVGAPKTQKRIHNITYSVFDGTRFENILLDKVIISANK